MLTKEEYLMKIKAANLVRVESLAKKAVFEAEMKKYELIELMKKVGVKP